MYQFVVTAPGQGVQQPGMLDPWLAAVPRATEVLAEWSDVVGFDLLAANRDRAMLADTAVAQPMITAAALLSWRLLSDQVRFQPERMLFAGHSVGELAAAAGAGYLTARTAMSLAQVRGAAMSAACAEADTAMAAVMPDKADPASDDVIVQAIRAAGLSVANRNGGGQFVAAGPAERIEAFVDSAPAGIRLVRLAVAGAFHTAAMDSAAGRFATAVAAAEVREPSSELLGNADGARVGGPDDLRRRLITQVTSPVRWDLCAAAIERLSGSQTLHIELAPGGTLTRMLERSRSGVRTVAVRAVTDIERLRAEIEPPAEERVLTGV